MLPALKKAKLEKTECKFMRWDRQNPNPNPLHLLEESLEVDDEISGLSLSQI